MFVNVLCACKNRFFPSAILGLIISALILTSCGGSGYSRLSGRYVLSESGQSYLVYNTEDEANCIVKITGADDNIDFDDLSTGDSIEIKIVIIESNGNLSTTEVFDYKKTSENQTNISLDILEKIQAAEAEVSSTTSCVE